VVAAQGYTDGERLAERELVYTGVVRTPVMAVARSAPFKGRMQGVAAERFATMADVWRLLGALPAGADPYPTPDLKGKSTQESATRLARMLGRMRRRDLLALSMSRAMSPMAAARSKRRRSHSCPRGIERLRSAPAVAFHRPALPAARP
jgi:uncharacterized hydantoinase/oxoprolinase family protein